MLYPKYGFTRVEVFSPHSTCLQKNAFTLAEVLITLGIIGVIAAMTLPALITNNREKATITAVKKAYSTISNAYKLAENEYGTPENWGLISYRSPEGAEEAGNKLAPFMQVTKNCGVKKGCLPDISYLEMDNKTKYTNFNSSDAYAKFQLSDGSIWYTYIYDQNCTYNWGTSPHLQTICAHIAVDINGYKKPNTLGKDVFSFYLTKYGIIPTGTALETAAYNFNSACVKDKGHIGTWGANGEGCAAWIIYNENMDYLRCKDLNWNTKTSCK